MPVRLLRFPAYFDPELSCEQIEGVLRIADSFTLGGNCFSGMADRWSFDAVKYKLF
jgi:hypothetical protein